MAEPTDLDRAGVDALGERIERLLVELRATAGRDALEQAEDLLRAVTDLYGAGLERIVCLVAEEAPDVLRRLADDDLVASLLVVHGLHPDGLAQRVEVALDSVRPFLAAHGGDVALLAVDEDIGAVQLRLLGSCDGCPSSAATLQQAVERAILEAAPEVVIIDVDAPSSDVSTLTQTTIDDRSVPVSLGRKPAPDPATGCGAVMVGDAAVR